MDSPPSLRARGLRSASVVFPRTPRVVLLAFGVLVGASSARADSGGDAVPGAREVREALRTFDTAFRARDEAVRLEALRVLGTLDHPRVADRLLRSFRKEGDPPVRQAALGGLVRQVASKERVVKKVVEWLLAQAEAERRRVARGESDFRIDRRTGDPDLESEEGRLSLASTAARLGVLREAVHVVRILGAEAPRDAADLAVFLQAPHDGLVVQVLGLFEDWRTSGVLPDLLELYRMYPTVRSWDSGAVVHPGGTDASARRAWLVRYGHPAKQRHRPEVVEALRACLQTLTGRAFDAPETLEAWLAATPPGERSAA